MMKVSPITCCVEKLMVTDFTITTIITVITTISTITIVTIITTTLP
jgi:hypothetical protein